MPSSILQIVDGSKQYRIQDVFVEFKTQMGKQNKLETEEKSVPQVEFMVFLFNSHQDEASDLGQRSHGALNDAQLGF